MGATVALRRSGYFLWREDFKWPESRDSSWLHVGHFLHKDPDPKPRWGEKNFPPTRPKIPDNSLVIAVFKKILQNRGWEKHINSHRGSLWTTVKMGTKAGCWSNLPQTFQLPPPPNQKSPEGIKVWLLIFVFLGTHSEVILFTFEFLLLKT